MRRLTLLLVLVAAAGSLLAFRPIMTTNATAVAGVLKLVHVTTAAGDFDSPQPSILPVTPAAYPTVGLRATAPPHTSTEGATVEKRPCTCIQVVHPVPRRNFLFHSARIYVDDELNIPIRYAAYDWTKDKYGKPELIEEYTYRDFTPNDKLSDADFDYRNPNYNFISK